MPVQMGGLLGGPKGMLAPLSNYWGAWPPLAPPLPTPMNRLVAAGVERGVGKLGRGRLSEGCRNKIQRCTI